MSGPVERYLPEVKQLGSRPPGAAPFTFLQLATMTENGLLILAWVGFFIPLVWVTSPSQ